MYNNHQTPPHLHSLNEVFFTIYTHLNPLTNDRFTFGQDLQNCQHHNLFTNNFYNDITTYLNWCVFQDESDLLIEFTIITQNSYTRKKTNQVISSRKDTKDFQKLPDKVLHIRFDNTTPSNRLKIAWQQPVILPLPKLPEKFINDSINQQGVPNRWPGMPPLPILTAKNNNLNNLRSNNNNYNNTYNGIPPQNQFNTQNMHQPGTTNNGWRIPPNVPPFPPILPSLATEKKKCPYCPTVCQESDLVRHMRKHSEYKPFKCPHCNKGFSAKVHLKNHMIVHTKEKLYKCNYCNKDFTQKHRLDKHIRSHTGEKPFECKHPGCKKRFDTNQNLKYHQRKHTGETYGCNHCDLSYTAKSSLTRHMRKMHKNKQ